jgi:phenylacetate-CoA ligase
MATPLSYAGYQVIIILATAFTCRTVSNKIMIMAGGPYWEEHLECLTRPELSKLQSSRFAAVLERAAKAPFYKNLLEKQKPGVRGMDGIRDLPFTGKQDLRDNFPYGFLAVPLEQVVRLHSSSGTTGNPTVVYHTRRDIEEWSNVMARCLFAAGARPRDVFQNMMGYGLFTGGLGLHYGAEKLGMLTIPIGPGNSRRQLWFMNQFRTTALHILPSYALRLAGLLAETGVNPREDLALRLAFIGAEPHSQEVRVKIQDLLGLKAYNSYGLSEICGPGVAFECEAQNGLHIWEDQVLAEIIDPGTGETLPDGEQGELVLTSLNREAMPLLRYRTGDLTRILPGTCACGRTHRRIERIHGRTDDMLIINGVNLFPIQVEQVLMRVPQVGTNYEIHIYKENFMDKLHIKVELDEAGFTDSLSGIEHLQKRLEEELAAEITVNPVVNLVEARSLQAHEGKAVRVFDHRNDGSEVGSKMGSETTG